MAVKTMKSLVMLALVAAVAGCSSPVKLDEGAKVEERQGAGTQTGSGDARAVQTVDATKGQGVDPLTQGPLAKRSIYFDFDSYTVKDQDRPTIEAHSRFLASNAGRKVRVEGHTDERGGSEYNLALGQRRSEAVARQMKLLGVKDDQVETVSFGKEKPKAQGHDEGAWAENRRADIAYR
jgi:peptidoglycan-associated lipoprotein